MNRNYNFNIKKKRPEELYNSVSAYFKGEILRSYASSKSIMRTQEKILIRALELLELEKKEFLILDAGCGPGFAAIYLNEIGYKTIALDLILDFLSFYDIKFLNPINSDMCFLPFKPSSFDAIISISALQWIYRDINRKEGEILIEKLAKSFFHVLKPNSKLIIQMYPKNDEIMKNIGKIFIQNTSFSGNFVIDNPNNQKKRKIFLLLKK